MPRFAVVVIALAAACGTSAAAAAADVGRGEILAKRWCAACHVVARGQAQGSTQAPPFSEIARRSGVDAGQLALYLLLPHPRMPDMALSRAEAADLAAYIAAQH